jgi:hypothetical protein
MSSDEAAWRELIAQYELPASADAADMPWPERENIGRPSGDPAQGHGPPAAADLISPETESSEPDPAPDANLADSDPQGSGADPGDQRLPGSGIDRTRVVRPANPVWRPATDAAEDQDDRYIPPPPPPLPRLDPVAKGAWAALIGGPLYLLLATFLSWQVSGFAALLAVAAFVGGFVVMIFRMGDGPSRGDGPDNGAVV